MRTDETMTKLLWGDQVNTLLTAMVDGSSTPRETLRDSMRELATEELLARSADQLSDEFHASICESGGIQEPALCDLLNEIEPLLDEPQNELSPLVQDIDSEEPTTISLSNQKT